MADPRSDGVPGSQAPMMSGGMPVLYGADGRPLPPEAFRSPFDFGPGPMLPPRWKQPDRPPREFQYVPGFNLLPSPRRESSTKGKPFAELRALSELCWQARVCINYRKNELAALKWNIVPKEDGKSPELRRKHSDAIDQITKFFAKPNQIDGVGWHQWIKQVVEEMLVTDALTFFFWPRKDGSPWAYVQVDGATMKPLIDEFGHLRGFQQVLYGYPATYYPAWSEESTIDDPKPGALRYCVHNPRVDNVYGTSPLEEVQPLIDTAVRRQLHHLAWYTDGNIPTATMEAPENWTDVQIGRAQTYYDNLFSGDDAQRHKVRIVPSGANFSALAPFEFNKDEADALITAVCAHFGVPPAIFVQQANRATAEETAEAAANVGAVPIRAFVRDLINSWIENDFEAEDVEFEWVIERQGEELNEAQALKTYVDAGILTVDEARAERGLDPKPKEEVPPGLAAGGLPGVPPPFGAKPNPFAPAAHPPAAGGPPVPGAGKQPPPPSGAKPGAAAAPPPFPPQRAAKAVADELAQWRRFAMRRVVQGRAGDPFDTEAVPDALRTAIATRLAKVSTKDEVEAVFEGALMGLTKRADKRPDPKGVAHMADVLRWYFNALRKDVLEHAASRLPEKDKDEEASA